MLDIGEISRILKSNFEISLRDQVRTAFLKKLPKLKLKIGNIEPQIQETNFSIDQINQICQVSLGIEPVAAGDK